MGARARVGRPVSERAYLSSSVMAERFVALTFEGPSKSRDFR